jgi:transcription termination factor NusB
MWNATCLESQQTHVERRARERLLHVARIYQESLTEEEAKQKILEIMKSCTVKDYRGIDLETSLPKYKIRKHLPDSRNIFVILIIVEDNENKTRKIKTLYTNYDELEPNWRRG